MFESIGMIGSSCPQNLQSMKENSWAYIASNKSNKARILSHKRRIDIIFMNAVHNIPVNQISLMVKHHYSTVSNIIQTYVEEGRTS